MNNHANQSPLARSKQVGRIYEALKQLRRLAGQVNTYAGIRVSGTPTRLTQLILGNLAIFKSRIGANHISIDGEDVGKARLLKERGFVQPGRPIDPELINSVGARFRNLLDQGKFTYRKLDPDGNVVAQGMESTDLDFREALPEVATLLTDPIRNLAQCYYGAGMKVVRINAWRNYTIPQDTQHEIYSNYWHFDPHTTDHLKIFVYLTDVSENDGPLHVGQITEYSHRTAFEAGKRAPPDSSLGQKITPEAILGNAGTVVICNTSTTFHRADIPADGHYRDIVQFVIAPSTNELPGDWFDWFEGGWPGYNHNGLLRLFRY